MQQYQKLLFVHTHDAQILQLLRAHTENVKMDEKKQICTIHINKLYAYNILSERINIEKLEHIIKKTFGESYALILKNSAGEQTHDREMAVPRTIHR